MMKILKNKKGGISVILSSLIVLTISVFIFTYMYNAQMEMHCRNNINTAIQEELKNINYNKTLNNDTHVFFENEIRRYISFIGEYDYYYEIYDKDKNILKTINSTETYDEKLATGNLVKVTLVQKNTAISQRLVNIISNEPSDHKIEITNMKFIE